MAGCDTPGCGHRPCASEIALLQWPRAVVAQRTERPSGEREDAGSTPAGGSTQEAPRVQRGASAARSQRLRAPFWQSQGIPVYARVSTGGRGCPPVSTGYRSTRSTSLASSHTIKTGSASSTRTVRPDHPVASARDCSQPDWLHWIRAITGVEHSRTGLAWGTPLSGRSQCAHGFRSASSTCSGSTLHRTYRAAGHPTRRRPRRSSWVDNQPPDYEQSRGVQSRRESQESNEQGISPTRAPQPVPASSRAVRCRWGAPGD